MSYTVPVHPYPPHARVHHITEDDPRSFSSGTAHVVSADQRADGTYLYHVRFPNGAVAAWPSFETIPAGLWRPGDDDHSAPPDQPAPAG